MPMPMSAFIRFLYCQCEPGDVQIRASVGFRHFNNRGAEVPCGDVHNRTIVRAVEEMPADRFPQSLRRLSTQQRQSKPTAAHVGTGCGDGCVRDRGALCGVVDLASSGLAGLVALLDQRRKRLANPDVGAQARQALLRRAQFAVRSDRFGNRLPTPPQPSRAICGRGRVRRCRPGCAAAGRSSM